MQVEKTLVTKGKKSWIRDKSKKAAVLKRSIEWLLSDEITEIAMNFTEGKEARRRYLANLFKEKTGEKISWKFIQLMEKLGLSRVKTENGTRYYLTNTSESVDEIINNISAAYKKYRKFK